MALQPFQIKTKGSCVRVENRYCPEILKTIHKNVVLRFYKSTLNHEIIKLKTIALKYEKLSIKNTQIYICI